MVRGKCSLFVDYYMLKTMLSSLCSLIWSLYMHTSCCTRVGENGEELPCGGYNWSCCAIVGVGFMLWYLDCMQLPQPNPEAQPSFIYVKSYLCFVVSCDYSYECSWFFVGCGWTWGEAYILVWGLSHEHLPIWIQCVLRVCCDLLVCSYLVIALLLEICSWTLTCLETINLHYPANPPFVIGLPCNWPLVDWVNEN